VRLLANWVNSWKPKLLLYNVFYDYFIDQIRLSGLSHFEIHSANNSSSRPTEFAEDFEGDVGFLRICLLRILRMRTPLRGLQPSPEGDGKGRSSMNNSNQGSDKSIERSEKDILKSPSELKEILDPPLKG
jgi:hypothetical protein